MHSGGGIDIKTKGVSTHVYVLSDFDPAGSTIYNTILNGSKKAPGGLSRFTDGVPVFVHHLALTAEQVKKWSLNPVRQEERQTLQAIH